MRAVLVMTVSVTLVCCATSPGAARLCEIVGATPGHVRQLPDSFDLSNWQSITLRQNRGDCADTLSPTPQMGLSADSRFATVLMDVGSGATSMEGWRCYLHRESANRWRLIGCAREWEF